MFSLDFPNQLCILIKIYNVMSLCKCEKKILVVKEKKSVFFYKDYMNNIRDFVHPTLSFSSGELVFLRVHGSRYVLSG